MKEFAELERKARAYDKVVGKLKQFMAQGVDPLITRADVQDFFPELKESEDEKIRKGIIDFLWKEKIFLQEAHSSVENNPKYRFVMDAIAWLEKQSGNNIKWNKNTKDNKPQVNHSVLMQTINGIAEGEWQGEQWHQYRWAGIVRDSDVLSWIELYDIEKQGEQKPADKPKFHKGEWIVWQDKCYKVNYNGCGYELVDQNGLSTSLEYGTVEESAHLWTIQDAKDGDILVTNKKQPFIFNGHYDEDTDYIYGYCGICDLVKDDSFYINEESVEEECNVWCVNENVYPATKEQCDILFSKMKDAGYEWDAEKKELKKISQRMISAEAKEAMYDKPACVWSEEDEKNLQGILDEIEANKSEAPEYDIDTYNRFIDWLKSLKDRVGCEANCTTTKEWGKEDEKMLDNCINALGDSSFDTYEIEEWVKSLKQRIGG